MEADQALKFTAMIGKADVRHWSLEDLEAIHYDLVLVVDRIGEEVDERYEKAEA